MKDIRINYLNNIYNIKDYDDIKSFILDNNINYEIELDKSINYNLNHIFGIATENILIKLKNEMLGKSFDYFSDVNKTLENILDCGISTWLDYNLRDYDLAFNLKVGFDTKYFHIILTKRKNGELYIIDILTK